jgi:hypothetical protein
MLRWAIVVILALVVAVGGTIAWNFWVAPPTTTQSVAQTSSSGRPRAVAPETSFDFGTMEQAAEGQHVFLIRNEGDGILELSPKKPTCGCQALILESEDVPPGEPNRLVWREHEGSFPEDWIFRVRPGGTVRATVTWNTRLETGELRESVPIATNDPDNPRITLVVHGFVSPLVMFSSLELRGEALSTLPTTLTFDVASSVLKEIQLRELKSVSGELKLRHQPIDPSETRGIVVAGTSLRCAYRVSVEVPPGLPIGPFHDRITLVVALPERPDAQGRPTEYSQDISVRIDVRGPVSVSHPLVDFGDVTYASGKKRQVLVHVRDVENPELEVAQVNPTFLELKITRARGRKDRFFVELAVPPQSPPGKFRGTVVLRTNHPDAKELRIEVTGTVVGQ